MKPYRLLTIGLLLMVLVLVACNGNGDDDETPPDPQALLTEAAANVNEAESFRFEVRQSGAPTFFSFEGFEDIDISLNSANATFESPNSVLATISVLFGGQTQDIAVIAVEDRQYYKHPVLTGGDWTQETLVPDFQPADLLSAESGIGNALLSMRDVTYVGNSEVKGVPVYHLRGVVDAELARAVTFGLMSTATGDVQMDVYVRREGARRVARIEIVEPALAGAEEDLSKTWEIDFDRYNQETNIAEPPVPTAGVAETEAPAAAE